MTELELHVLKFLWESSEGNGTPVTLIAVDDEKLELDRLVPLLVLHLPLPISDQVFA